MMRFTYAWIFVALLTASASSNLAFAQCDSCNSPVQYASPATYTAYSPVAAYPYGTSANNAYAYPGYGYAAPVKTPWYPGKALSNLFGGNKTYAYTAYQPYTHTVPVTTLQPVSSCDPCSGQATTAYRPVTTYATQTCYYPTTYNYRPLFNRPLLATSYYAPAASYAQMSYSVPACSSCGMASSSCGCASGVGTASYSSPGCSGCGSGVTTTPSESTGVPMLPPNFVEPTSSHKPTDEEKSLIPGNDASYRATPKAPASPKERTASLWGPATVQTAIYSKTGNEFKTVSESKPQEEKIVLKWHSAP